MQMLTLAIDTAANFCSACLFDSEAGRIVAAEERHIGRGHAEQLIDVVSAVRRSSGRDFGDIGRIAVAVGPGSFTGIRVGVAAARGFGLALGVPVSGVTTLEALAADAQADFPDLAVTIAIRGGRGQVFLQSFDASGAAVSQPVAVDEATAHAVVPQGSALLAGNAASDVASGLGRPVTTALDRPTGSIGTVARIGAHSETPPVPLYLRGADAKPQQGFALPRAGAADTAEA